MKILKTNIKSYVAMMGLLFLLISCSDLREMNETEFRKMPMVHGRLIKFEEIPWDNDFSPWSGAGPHFIVEIKTDSDEMILMTRLMTDVGWWRPQSGVGLIGLEGIFPNALFDKIKKNNRDIQLKRNK